jgi:hypothetical protein
MLPALRHGRRAADVAEVVAIVHRASEAVARLARTELLMRSAGHPLRVVITRPGRGTRQRQGCLVGRHAGCAGRRAGPLTGNGHDGDVDRTDRRQEGRDRFARRTGGLRGGAGMSLPVREQRALRGIEAGIWSSDPGLASWMAFFSRLTADEEMPGHERGPLAIVRICVMVRAAAAATACAVARAAGAFLRAATAPVLWTGPSRSLDSRYTSPVTGPAWYSYRYHGPPRFRLSIMEPGLRSMSYCRSPVHGTHRLRHCKPVADDARAWENATRRVAATGRGAP